MFKFVVLACLAGVSFGASEQENAPEVQDFIVGGTDTDISEVPYQIAMYKNGGFMCGGSIVSKTHIVTAAHCVKGNSASSLSIRAGSSSTKSGGVTIHAKSTHVHPKYNSKTMDYDVAVLELAKPLSYSKKIKPISLVDSVPPDGAEVKPSGWGLLKEDGSRPSTLQSVVVPVVARKTCSSKLKGHFNVTPRMICAGVEGEDACQGDSGGPLAYNDKLAGVVSYGIGCARKNRPGIYTNIAHPDITSFIKKHTNI